MRILLIQPPFYRFLNVTINYFPLGLGYIGAALLKAGYEVKIYHADYMPRSSNLETKYREIMKSHEYYWDALTNDSHECWCDIRKVIGMYNPDIVGTTAMDVTYPSATKILKIAKDINSDIVTVLGGPSITIRPQMARKKFIDYAIVGEGEEAFVSLVNNIKKGSYDNLKNIKGVCLWDDNNFYIGERAPYIDANKYSKPARDILSFKKYDSDVYGDIMTSRGCPFKCYYCNAPIVSGTQVRYRKIKNVIEEITEVHENYGTRYFHFYDDVFTLNKNRTMKLLTELEKCNLDIRFWCNTRTDLLDTDIVKSLKSAGCDEVAIGIESGSDRILKLINKKITVKQIKECIELLNKWDMGWSAFIMLGFPMETEEDIRKTIKLMEEIDPPRGFVISLFTPYYGTPLYEYMKKYKLLPDTEYWGFYTH